MSLQKGAAGSPSKTSTNLSSSSSSSTVTAAEAAKRITAAAFDRATAQQPKLPAARPRNAPNATQNAEPAVADANAVVTRRKKFKPGLPVLNTKPAAAAAAAAVPRGVPGKPLAPARRSLTGQKRPAQQQQQQPARASPDRPPSGRLRPTTAAAAAAASSTRPQFGRSPSNKTPSSKTLITSASPGGRFQGIRSLGVSAADVFSREIKPPAAAIAKARPGPTAAAAAARKPAAVAATAAPATGIRGLTVVQSQGLVKQQQQQQQGVSRSSSLSSSDLEDDETLLPTAVDYQRASVRLGLEAGLCIAEELLRGHSRTLQSTQALRPTQAAAAAAATAAAGKLNSTVFYGLNNTTHNPLYSLGADSNTSSSNSTTATAGSRLSAAALSAAAAAADTAVVLQGKHSYDILDNPMFMGRSVLQWLAKHSESGSLSSPRSRSGAPTAAAARLDSSITGSSSGGLGSTALLPVYYKLQQQQQQLTVDPRSGSSVSVDSSALSALIKERISTDQLSIATETAPDTSRFTSARSSFNSAATGSRSGPRSTVKISISEALDELYDLEMIEYSQDGQPDGARKPPAAVEEGELEKSLQPGDLIYEMIPNVADRILSWSGVEGLTRMSSFGSIGTMGTLHDTYRSAMIRSPASSVAPSPKPWNMTGTDQLSPKPWTLMGSDQLSPKSPSRLQRKKSDNWQLLLSKQKPLNPSRFAGTDHGAAAAVPGSAADEEKLAKLATAEHQLRQHGLLENYLSSTSAALLGAQAALMTVINVTPDNSRRASITTAGAAAADGGLEGSKDDNHKEGSTAAAAAAAESGRGLAAAAAGGDGVRGFKRLESRRMIVRNISRRMKKEVWLPASGADPLPLVWSPLGIITCIAYLTAAVYYFYIRITYSLDMGQTAWYGAVVFACEVIGFTSVVPYGLMLLRRCKYVGQGLPADDGKWKLPKPKRFIVRVLIPCYKEDLDTIKETVQGALTADLPPSCSRVVYLCDDGKSKEKAAYIAGLGDAAVYVSGRVRKPGEINGKSANLNNCLRNVIYADYISDTDPHANASNSSSSSTDKDRREAETKQEEIKSDSDDAIPPQELVVIFDADMVAKQDFFRRILEIMWDDTVGLCLTPQSFSNIHPACDVWNHINVQFWEYILPGCDALGYVGCTGTNFCIRANALQKVGWFPEYTITEDYALSMELKLAGVRGRYLPRYLAVGEAPEEIRSTLQQRSRWCKGHMQVFFSRRCPLFHPRLKLLHRILYTNGTWAYFATVITTCIYTLIPFISLVFGLHPVSLSRQFTLAATLNFAAGAMVNFHVQKIKHFQGLWLALISNHLLSFTYFKAILNTLMSLAGLKKRTGFKATDKTGAAAVAAAAGVMLTSAIRALSTFSVTVGHRMTGMIYRNRPVVLLDLNRPTTAAAAGDGGTAAGSGGSGSVAGGGAAADAAAGAAAAGTAAAGGTAAAVTGTAAADGTAAGGGDNHGQEERDNTQQQQQQQEQEEERDEGEEQQPHEVRGSAGLDVSNPGTRGPGPLGEAKEGSSSGGSSSGSSSSGSSSSSGNHTAAAAATNAAAEAMHLAGLDIAKDPPAAADVVAPTAVVVAVADDPKHRTRWWPIWRSRSQSDKPKPKPSDDNASHWYDWMVTNAEGLGRNAKGSKLDPWVMLLSLSVSLTAVISGIYQIAVKGSRYDFQSVNGLVQVFTSGQLHDFMLLALLLAGINAIAPLLFFIYFVNKGLALKVATYTGQVINTALFIGAVIVLWLLTPTAHNFPAALRLSTHFLSAQRVTSQAMLSSSNTLPAWDRLPQSAIDAYPWLSRSPTGNANDIVQGGFYMSGDYVKQTLPLANSMSMLAWSMMAFREGYEKAGVYGDLQNSLQVGAQYLMDCHIGQELYVAQIGRLSDYEINVTTQSGFWGLPQDMPPNRSPIIVNVSNPAAAAAGAQVLAAAAAALSATSFLLESSQSEFAAAALNKAHLLFDLAEQIGPQINKTLDDLRDLTVGSSSSGNASAAAVGVEVFGSSSVMDDMAFAATWLAKASGDHTFLDKANTYLDTYWSQEAPWGSAATYWPSYDNMAWAAAVLLLQQPVPSNSEAAVMASKHREALSLMYQGWLMGRNNWTDVTTPTPTGLPWVSQQPLPTAAATAQLGMLWAAGDPQADGGSSSSSSSAGRLSSAVQHRLQCFALQQAMYILGRSRGSLSHVVGYGSHYPLRPQHRLASCTRDRSTTCDVVNGLLKSGANPVVLQGALVSGPAIDDTYNDVRADSAQSAVGLHHNGPLIGLLGGLLTTGVTQGQCSSGQGLYQMLSVNLLP